MVHDVRIDLKPDDYIDYMTYKLRPGAARPCALVLRGQRGPAPWCCALAAPRPGAGGRAVRATATECSQTIFIFMV